MAKAKSAFFCNNCGYESPKWLGKCPACNEWNTFVEEVVDAGGEKNNQWDDYHEHSKKNNVFAIHEVDSVAEKRINSEDDELNNVLGGGIVLGSIILVAGEPGIGKSTLFLQQGLKMQSQRILYISGEESVQQIKLRADRIGIKNDDFYLLAETKTNILFKEIKKLKPTVIIVDSIQTMESNLIDAAAGSVSQIKQTAAEFQKFAKETNTPVFLIGHITKEGSIAGPKILEHMVDVVLQFEGDRHYAYRMLRTLKNRFGSTNELGIYEMTNQGMQAVNNPSAFLIAQRNDTLSGSAIAASMEGMRPLLIEVQALVTQSVYGTPQRTVTGFDARRLQLLLAVLEKRGGFAFGMKDVFVNIAGGLKIEDPALDLSIILALLSSYEDITLPQGICFAGEVGLNGEIRAVNRIQQRISEAEKLGFEKIFISSFNIKGLETKKMQIQVIPIERVDQAYQQFF